MTIGKKHNFLGMSINITEDKQLEIEMKEQLLEAIEEFGEHLDKIVTTPESSHLFIVNEQAKKLYEEKRSFPIQ